MEKSGDHHHSPGSSERSLAESLNQAVRLLSEIIHRLERALDQVIPSLATKSDLTKTQQIIMSAISDFLDKQTAFNDRVSKGIDAAVASVSAITDDIATLNDKITELQNSVGGVTPEDQARIDALESQGEALATKAEAVQNALAALDALTPPKAPPVP